MAKFEIKRCASCATTSFPGFFLYFEGKDPGNEVACATLLLLPHFDVICDLLLNRRTATWNLFVNYAMVTLSLFFKECVTMCLGFL